VNVRAALAATGSESGIGVRERIMRPALVAM
jgi:hypothetical protein